MTALRKILIEEEPVVTTNAMVARASTPKLYVVATKGPIEATEATPEAAGGALKNILLFFAAPFIGLAYIVAFPLVGIAVLALVVARAAAKIEAVRTVGLALKHVVMAVATPFIGLAYIVFFPVIGLGVLAWLGGRAVLAAGAR
jgi:hypothetical protein